MENQVLLIVVILAILAVVVIKMVLPKLQAKSAPVTVEPPRLKKRSSNPSPAAKEANPAGPKLTIYFGSQTGTAEGYAKRLLEEGTRNGFNATTVDLEEFDAERLAQESLCIFVVSTYGEGDPTDSSVEFTKWLNKSVDGGVDADLLRKLSYTVFGLGNKQYEFYNKMGKVVHAGLEKLGATPIFDRGEGDDDGNIEEDFDSWKTKMWDTLSVKVLKREVKRKSFSLEAPALSFRTVYVKPSYDEDGNEIPFNRSRVGSAELMKISGTTRDYFDGVEAKVLVNRELRADVSEGSTVHVELDISSAGLKYGTADNLGVLPENDRESVVKVAKALGYDLNTVFDLEPLSKSADVKPIIPTPCTIEEALTRYVDLNGKISKHTIQCLAYYATDPLERAQLIHLVSPEGKGEYNQWVTNAWRTVPEIIEAYPSIKIDIGNLVEITSRLAVRYYTIASSSLVHPNRIHLTVSVIKQPKIENRVHIGVCSNHIANAIVPVNENGKRVYADNDVKRDGKNNWPSLRVIVRNSTFRLPEDSTLPVLMIGPGTGIAPMRAFIQERHYQRKIGKTVGDTVLYFGSRYQSKDFIYEDEIMSYAREGTLSALHLAFSRDNLKKTYVQHKLKETAVDVWNYIQAGAHIYVCGGISMGSDVLATLATIAEEQGHMTPEAAGIFVKEELRAKGRYIQELWS